MIDGVLAADSLALVAATVALFVAGPRPIAGLAARAVLGAILVAGSGAISFALTGDPFPAIVGTGTIAIVALFVPARWWAVGALGFAAVAVTFVTYGVYLLRATFLLGGDPASYALGALLYALELGAMGLLASAAFEMVDALCAPAPGLPMTNDPERWPVVCLQVPTYNEPPDLVIETIRSLVALDYPALRVQVIDNNTTDEDLWRPVEAACAELFTAGHLVEFSHLPIWPGYKAGALNWGLAHLKPDVEIVGIVDADYVVDARWLRATVPYFGDPAVAFVQTPQDYRAWQESAFYRACYIGLAAFFKLGMVSRSRRNAIIFAGTMGLVRRSALETVGGWDEAIITEDAEVSLRLLARGHQSVYVPQAFGHGIMPLTYEGLRKQRFRWAFGGIQILRRHWRLLLPWNRRSGLTLGQRSDYLVGGLWWFNDALILGFSLFVGAAAVGAIVGRPFVVQRLSALGLALPIAFIWLNLTRYLWGLRVATGAGIPLALAALRVNLSLSWVVALACVRGLVEERGVFLRTPKFRRCAGDPRVAARLGGDASGRELPRAHDRRPPESRVLLRRADARRAPRLVRPHLRVHDRLRPG